MRVYSLTPASGGTAVSLPITEADVTSLTSDLAAKLVKASNLSDLASAATARTNLVLGSVDNTADTAKPVSTAQQTALNLKANSASPTFTGAVVLPEGDDAAAGTASRRTLGLTGSKAMPGTATLDQVAAPAADVPFGTHKITGLGNGSAAQDAAAFGQIPVAGTVGGYTKIVRRSGTSSAKQNNTLANDDTLLWAVAANSVWFFEAFLTMTAASATMDVKFGWSLPAGATMVWGGLGTATGGGWQILGTAGTVLAASTESTTPNFGSAASAFTLQLNGWVINSSTAGTANLQWAQNTTEAANLTMNINSLLRLTALA